METIGDVNVAKTHLSQLLERAHAGEEIIIAKSGKPYACLVPLEPARKRPLGFVDAPSSDTFDHSPTPVAGAPHQFFM